MSETTDHFQALMATFENVMPPQEQPEMVQA